MANLAELLMRYGYGPQDPGPDETYDTRNVLDTMQKRAPTLLNRLAGAIPQNHGTPSETTYGPFGDEYKVDYVSKGPSLAGMLQGGLDTAGRWLGGNPEIGKDTLAPLGLAGMGAAFGPANALGVFGGRLAKTADHAALTKAEQMAASGADKQAIWNATGWFQGKDGNWRFEIDDSGLKTQLTSSAKQGEIHHPKLQQAYPDLGKMDADVRLGVFPGGSYRMPPWGIPEIKVSGPTSAARRKAAAHELQHDAQTREGWPTGTYREDPAYWGNAGEVEARNAARRVGMTSDQRRSTPPWLTEDRGMEPAWISAVEAIRRKFAE